MSSTASLGVQCSPASSLFSSLNLRSRSSKMVPMAWLSSPGSLTSPSSFRTGLGLRFTVGDKNRSIRTSSAPLVESRAIWFRNSNFSRMSWTFGENPSR